MCTHWFFKLALFDLRYGRLHQTVAYLYWALRPQRSGLHFLQRRPVRTGLLLTFNIFTVFWVRIRTWCSFLEGILTSYSKVRAITEGEDRPCLFGSLNLHIYDPLCKYFEDKVRWCVHIGFSPPARIVPPKFPTLSSPNPFHPLPTPCSVELRRSNSANVF